MKPVSEIIIKSAHPLLVAHRLAEEYMKTHIANLIWEHLRTAAIAEGITVDELHRQLVSSLRAEAGRVMENGTKKRNQDQVV